MISCRSLECSGIPKGFWINGRMEPWMAERYYGILQSSFQAYKKAKNVMGLTLLTYHLK